MSKIVLILSSLMSFTASAYMVNTISEDQKLDISENLHIKDSVLQSAIAKHIQGSDLQITSFNSPGRIFSGKISFQFKEVDKRKTASFDCNLYILHEADISITNCSGTESGEGNSNSKLKISTFNTVSENNSAQEAIVLKGLYTPEASGALPTPSTPPNEGSPDAGK